MSNECEVVGNDPTGGGGGSTVDVRAYEVLIKADGVIGENCDFLSSNDAIVAGKRSMFVKSAESHVGVSQNSPLVGESLIIRKAGHPFSLGDKCVVTSSDVFGSIFVEGVFIVDDVIDSQDFSIPLKDNTAVYAGKSGGYSDGLNLSFHKADPNTIVFLAGVDYTGLNVIGESNGLSTIAGSNCIDMTVAGIIGKFINFENIGMRPSGVGGKCFNLAANANLQNISFNNNLYNGFLNAEYNGTLWGGVFSSSGIPIVNALSFNGGIATGVFSQVSDINFDFDNFDSLAGTNLTVQDISFNSINGVNVRIADDIIGYNILRNSFDNCYHHCVLVDADTTFNSDGFIRGNFFRNGVDAEFVPDDPKFAYVRIGEASQQFAIQGNRFSVQGAAGNRVFYALELDAQAGKNFGQIQDNYFSSIRVTGIRLLAGQALQVDGNNFSFNGTSAIEFAAGFVNSHVINNLLFGSGVIINGVSGAGVTLDNNNRK